MSTTTTTVAGKIADKDFLDFINYITLIWLNRIRSRNPRVHISDSLIRQRGKEIAEYLNVPLLVYMSINTWWVAELRKIAEVDRETGLCHCESNCNTTIDIHEIIDLEVDYFYKNREKLEWIASNKVEGKDGDDDDEIQRDISSAGIVSDAKADDFKNFLVTQINNYDEALDCLNIIEKFALRTLNLEAVNLISQIGDLIRQEEIDK